MCSALRASSGGAKGLDSIFYDLSGGDGEGRDGGCAELTAISSESVMEGGADGEILGDRQIFWDQNPERSGGVACVDLYMASGRGCADVCP